MPPIFPPRSNLFAKASIVAAAILLIIIAAAAVWYVHSSTFNKVGVAVPQPVPFPHGFHVSGLGLDCRYCHDSVDKSSFANLPPTETCMSCHSQVAKGRAVLKPLQESWDTGQPLQWNRVNQVADYVYFDHSIHVNKGVGCETCHGRVDQMTTHVKANTFYMDWCLKCHRTPEKFLRPRDQVYTMGYTPAGDQSTIGKSLVEEYGVMNSFQLMNCSICHR